MNTRTVTRKIDLLYIVIDSDTTQPEKPDTPQQVVSGAFAVQLSVQFLNKLQKSYAIERVYGIRHLAYGAVADNGRLDIN